MGEDAVLRAIRATPGFWFLASPYSARNDRALEDYRAHLAWRGAAYLLSLGVHVFSPIHATHSAALVHDLPRDADHWRAFNAAFIDAAAGMIVHKLPDWEYSKGVRMEIDYCRIAGKPIYSLSKLNTLGEFVEAKG